MEFRIAQAQDEKATPGFGVETGLCLCPKYSQVCSASTAHGKNANAQNGYKPSSSGNTPESKYIPRTLHALIPEYWGETTA